MKKKLALLAVSALLVTGCGSGNGKTKIGVLQFGSFEALQKATDGFVHTLNDSEIKDKIEIKISNPNADGATNASMASTLASSSDLLYGVATPSASALKSAVASFGLDTPVLFSAVTNPLGAKLVTSLDKPGGNCTGVTDLSDIAAELDILAKFNVHKIVSFYTATEVNSVYQADIADVWCKSHNVEHVRKTITSASEIASALDMSSIPADVDALFLPTDDTIANAIGQVKQANETRTNKLIIAGCDVGIIEGSIFCSGINYYSAGVQAAQMAISIIKDGKKPADIPVQDCSTSEITINQTWATSLGITIPQDVLNIEGAKII
ncbi:MAG: ABC transporter substrate-binding protein [Erysipelotrichaceae bacterium]|jgi:putative ABC transport system substrate-binding protein|nr:ABC transporter substrate-binding protein [Erysipelotrichaceae bacterium]